MIPWPLASWFPTEPVALELSPEARHALADVSASLRLAVQSLVLPTVLLYATLYALVRGEVKRFGALAWLSVLAFLYSSWAVVVPCSAVRSLQLFGVAIGIMKALDLYVRRHSPPRYAYDKRPSDAVIALILLTELRYESFIPNHIRTTPAPAAVASPTAEPLTTTPRAKPPRRRFMLEFSEPANLALHGLLFSILQLCFPQHNPTVLALQILLAIYVLWESLQLMLRYRTSPPLFGPIYKASSLGSFWSETWHSAFASPCRSLAYDPIRRTLPVYGVPASFARAIGIVASFGLMGFFHVFALAPLLPVDALLRIAAFFLLNGIGAVIEGAVWGRRAHWGKTLLAWAFELAVATWTVEGLSVPNGLRNIRWESICDVGRESSHLF
ncbi:hypothetical protein VTO42DRAFT_6534 [Malbranchea cinnamomea]